MNPDDESPFDEEEEQFYYEKDMIERIRSGLATSRDAEYLVSLKCLSPKLTDRVANGLATTQDADEIAIRLGIFFHE
jgi:hypothetical protein